jgi:exodeoxyribonuclease VII small subunit
MTTNNNAMENYSYKQAIEELENIVSEIESGNLDLDELLKKVERAATLIIFCKEKLKKSEITLEQVIKRLDVSEE